MVPGDGTIWTHDVRVYSRPGGLVDLLYAEIFEKREFREQFRRGQFNLGQRVVIFSMLLQIASQFVVFGALHRLTAEELRLLRVMQCMYSPALVEPLVREIAHHVHRDRLLE